MIFYTAINDEGRTILCGTQADAKAINKDFQQIDIPVDKHGLQAFVQESLNAIFECNRQITVLKGMANGMPADAEPDTSDQQDDEAVEPAKPPVDATLSTRQRLNNVSYEATEIEDFLLNRASVAQVENIFGCLGNRFAELRTKD